MVIKAKQTGGNNDDAKHEQALQAVLLADSFTKTFRPLSLDKSKVLCPLNNVPMIDYALEFLAGAGVEEVFVVCLRDEVEEHILQNAWAKSSLRVTVVKDSSLTNAGDALRELDKRNLVQSDPFILMYGDTVTNVDIGPALVEHKLRHKKDNSAIMTMLFKRTGGLQLNGENHSSIRAASDDLVVGVDPSQSNRILVYDDHSKSKTLAIPCSFFASHSSVDLHTNWLDCGIDICSPDVLARFSDEFDYRDIRREFVANSVAEEEEGLQNKIFAHILKDSEYAARVHDFSCYAAISQDLLRRWCYPVVPDNMPNGYEKKYRYALQRQYMYREMKQGPTKMGRSSTFKGAGMVGSHGQIGNDCNIEGTVIGNSCNIDSGVTLTNAFLWDNVRIEEGATIIESILANDCIIKAGAKLNRGCIIGRGCVIGKGVELPEFSRITQMDDRNEDFDNDGFDDFSDHDDEEDEVDDDNKDIPNKISASVVGPDGIGRVWKPIAGDDSDEEEEDDPVAVVQAQSIGFDFTLLFKNRVDSQQESDDAFSDDGDNDVKGLDNYDADGAVTFGTTTNVDEHGILIAGRQRGVDVVKELKTICLEHEESSPVENLAIELNSFKFSQNASYSDCTMAALLAVLEKMNITPDLSAGKLVASLKHHLEHWGPLLRKMSIGLEEEKSVILALEQAATGGDPMGETLMKEPCFRFMLQTLHDQEVVSEEAILLWASERRNEDRNSLAGKIFNQQPTQDFLEWLEEDDDDESDDEGETDEE